MAFCTNCGANMDANSHFCTKCGKSVSPAGTAPAAPAPAQSYTPPAQTYTPPAQTYTPGQPSSGGSGIGKILLVIGGVLVLIFVFFVAGVALVAHRVKNRIKNGVYVTENGKNSTVQTPFGRASTSQSDAKTVARQMGVDPYPGAVGGESSTAQFGNMTTASVKLTTDDSVDKVAAFYKSRYPQAMTSMEGSNKFSLVGGDKDGTLTITAESMGSGTRIEIAKVGGLKINVQTH